MQQEIFQSRDFKINISDTEIVFHKVVFENNKKYWFHSFLLICLLVYLNIEDFQAGVRKESAFLWVIILIGWSFPHLEKIFNFIFFEKWGNKILIEDISKIKVLEPVNEFESGVKISVNSNRRKIIAFRIAEGQLDKFIEAIKSRHPLISSAIYSYS